MKSLLPVVCVFLVTIYCCVAGDFETAAGTECAALLEAWRKQGAAHDDESRQALAAAGVQADQPSVVEEALADGDVASLEIKIPGDSDKVDAKVLLNLGEIPGAPYDPDRMDCVIRRMTKKCFEVWTPKHGWLFDAKGKLLNEAFPPRRDGTGREWHGAFLPNGSWVTTDLWELDKTLTFFSRSGKFLREVKAAKLVPLKKDDYWNQSLIGWARCDRRGEGWVVSVGEGPGRGCAFVAENGNARLLKDNKSPWKLCYPRDLEPKGMYTALSRPSDDFQTSISFNVPGHGMWTSYPTYGWGEKEWNNRVVPNGDHNFGFLPGSHDVFIGASDRYPDASGHGHLKTWLFSKSGKCQGWMCATYLADSPDGKAICFRDGGNHVVALGQDFKVQSCMQFEISGTTVQPVKLFTDLKLGFFLSGKELVLARW